MELGLKGKVALVAASSKGLGRACAEALAQEGAKVTICARDEEALNKTKSEIAAATGAEILAVPADMSRAADIEYVIQRTVDRLGGLQILITNAGGPPAGYFPDFNDEQWQAAVNLTLMSSVRLIRAAIPHLRQAGWGRIVNITSMTVKEPVENQILSNSIRAAVHGMAKTLAGQLAQEGITINNVMPGFIQTDRFNQLATISAEKLNKTIEEIVADIGRPVPAGRLGQPQEVAALVAFLASEQAGYITGVSIPVDGGKIAAAF
jgi:3-oxoacyl-[acyl-carrier protein] reductase